MDNIFLEISYVKKDDENIRIKFEHIYFPFVNIKEEIEDMLISICDLNEVKQEDLIVKLYFPFLYKHKMVIDINEIPFYNNEYINLCKLKKLLRFSDDKLKAYISSKGRKPIRLIYEEALEDKNLHLKRKYIVKYNKLCEVN